jgi:hypothetical protein
VFGRNILVRQRGTNIIRSKTWAAAATTRCRPCRRQGLFERVGRDRKKVTSRLSLKKAVGRARVGPAFFVNQREW